MPGSVIGELMIDVFFDISYLSFHFHNPDIRVKVGDRVEKGQPLVVLSAMKMEMVVQSPVAGTIKTLDITNGMKLEGEDLIITFE